MRGDRDGLRRLWEARARAEGLDPREDFWQWDAQGDRLLVRPGPAAQAARLFQGEMGLEAITVMILEGVTSCVVDASRSPLRRAPGHDREQVSQLRLGQRFGVWHRDPTGEWCLGAGEDGYPGWMRAWHLLPAPEADPVTSAPGSVVTARSSRLLAFPAADAAILQDLSFGCLLAPAGPPEGDFQPCLLPDGQRAWAPAADLEERPGDARSRLDCLGKWGRRLLGVPYEWGGASSWGFDCSGLVQTLFTTAGLDLPRDADQQARQGCARDPADPDSWEAGDLLFYGREGVDHVGILLEPGRLLHARAYVRLEKLEKGGALETLRPLAARGLDLT